MYIIFDNCIVDRLAGAGINPIQAIRGTGFKGGYTPDLKIEYETSLAHPNPSAQTKCLIREILRQGELIGFFGFDGPPDLGLDEGEWISRTQNHIIDSIPARAPRPTGIPGNRTDAHLVALAQKYIVLTANEREAHWKCSLSSSRIVRWNDLKPLLAAGNTFGHSILTLT